MNILRSLLYTTAILLASITAVAGSFILFAEFTGPELYAYAQGTVVRILPDTSQGDIALVHFTTKQHISIEFQIPDAFPHYRIGATLPVKYKPESPSRCLMMLLLQLMACLVWCFSGFLFSVSRL